MAADIDIKALRAQLRSSSAVAQNPFRVLQSIATLIGSRETEETGREMLLRAFEWRQAFGNLAEVLDSMARATGLFPHADAESLSLRERLAYEFHRPLNLGDAVVFHREQAEVYRKLLAGDRVILSAPTSFGKSKIIDAMIATGRYDNVAVIVPTLALIDETRRRLSVFSDQFKIVTHVTQPPAKRNIFIFTAERAVAYDRLPKIDFFVIDEFYKLGAMSEDETRTVSLNEAFYRLLKGGGQFYLLGPSIDKIPSGLEEAYRCTFYPTRFATVVVETTRVKGSSRDLERLLAVARDLEGPTLIYCASPAKVNDVARALVEDGIGKDSNELADAAAWVSRMYHPDWILAQGLTRGVGIHHGRLPRSLAQFVVRAFNDERLSFLVCSSTLIEGVNTRAKNVLIWDNKIANRRLDFFTFNNIKGRSGRMFQHFVGKVFLFDDPPQEELPFVDVPLFSQDDSAPDSLLIQLDEDDLSEDARERMSKYSDDEALPIEILRRNKALDPAKQVELARHIEANIGALWSSLSWTGFPRRSQLTAVCNLIWDFLVDKTKSNGVFSGAQLSFKTWQLYETVDSAKRVRAELAQQGKWAPKSVDEAVERVLQFERNWAGFELPRLLMAVSLIQEHVLTTNGYIAGDYSAFASQVESLFRDPIVTALDEYGIPIQVGQRIRSLLRTRDDLDTALAALRELDVARTRLGPFEVELVQDAKRFI